MIMIMLIQGRAKHHETYYAVTLNASTVQYYYFQSTDCDINIQL